MRVSRIVSSEKSSIIDADAVIWTTTPWTIPGNRAIAYGKDIEYALYEIKDAKKPAYIAETISLVFP